jgi:hypothetical protein
MSNAIRYPVAELNGELVWADELARDGARPSGLRCAGCGAAVTLRAGQRNRPHFAHESAVACAGGETALHATTIRVLRDGILAAAEAQRSFPLALHCEMCMAEREADLARVAHDCRVDQSFQRGIRPDLLMLSAAGKPLYVIEVVVTHEPEEAALQLYRDLDLPCVRVWPAWESLAEFREGLRPRLLRKRPGQTGCFDVIDRCRFPRHVSSGPPRSCRTCRRKALRVSVEVSLTRCWRCSQPQRVLDLYVADDDELALVAAGCPDLPGVDAIARQRRVNLKWSHSQAAGGSYLMHTCFDCRATSGDNFLYGSMGSDAPTPVTTEPVWQMVVCESGHWDKLGERPWPPSVTVERPADGYGLVGEPAQLFGATSRSEGVALRPVDASNIRAITRMMMGLDR